LVQLQKGLQDIEATGTQVVGISYDSLDVLKKFSGRSHISYPLLYDEDSKTIDAYGIRNQSQKKGSRGYGIPYPGTFVVDQQGVVRAKLFLDGYIKRHSVADLIKAANDVK